MGWAGGPFLSWSYIHLGKERNLVGKESNIQFSFKYKYVVNYGQLTKLMQASKLHFLK